MANYKFVSVDDYSRHIPKEHSKQFSELRNNIKSTIPEAEEIISYNMPAYKYNGILVYFAFFPNHIEFYPTPSGIAKFKEQLRDFVFAKGSIKFSFDKELPKKLIEDICKFRLDEKKRNKKTNH
ncbi:MAG: DUF1801 domain-containing protein [Bacteroidales bacterium]|nr:DUF1801 domain-containing protein [Bacteroidales bacterium]